MGILFITSIVALFALLWAAISVARHVRRVRRRQKNAAEVLACAHVGMTSPQVSETIEMTVDDGAVKRATAFAPEELPSTWGESAHTGAGVGAKHSSDLNS